MLNTGRNALEDRESLVPARTCFAAVRVRVEHLPLGQSFACHPPAWQTSHPQG